MYMYLTQLTLLYYSHICTITYGPYYTCLIASLTSEVRAITPPITGTRKTP